MPGEVTMGKSQDAAPGKVILLKKLLEYAESGGG
jgi:hypothetical protein